VRGELGSLLILVFFCSAVVVAFVPVVSETCTKAPDVLYLHQTATPESLIKNTCGIYEPSILTFSSGIP